VPPARQRARLRALRRAEGELRVAQVLLDLALSLADVTTSHEAAQRIAEAVPPITGCDRSWVLLPDEDGRFVAHGYLDPSGPPTTGDADDLAGRLAQFPATTVMFLDDTTAVVTVRVRADVRAIITARWDDARRVPAAAMLEVRLTALADQAAGALGNAGLLDTVRHQALHDALTGLPNQTLFNDRAAHALARARREGTRLAVGVLDLDRFKTVNDSLGHRAGDGLLIQVAGRLLAAVREPDTVARMGGDEFTLLLADLHPHGEAIVAERILAAFEEPFLVDGHHIRVSPSIGLASFPEDGDTPERLLRGADSAMYRAKENGRNTWATYASGMAELAYDRLTLEADLHRAVQRRELRLSFLPIVRLSDRRQVAVEALVRWSHPSFGMLGPADFVPLAEEIGLVAEIDAWVLRQACLELGRADAGGTPLERVAVNVSARTLAHPSFEQVIVDALGRGGLTPDRLVIEVTGAADTMRSTAVMGALIGLRDAGVAVALDDFGRGHIPLADLGELPVDLIKLDPSLVGSVRTPDDQVPILAALVAMAHGLGLQVVAEGVETAAQLAVMDRLGCDLAQGYLMGRAGDALQAAAAAPSTPA
jgi:diguanylate cyclase (GGDEF)-like protein